MSSALNQFSPQTASARLSLLLDPPGLPDLDGAAAVQLSLLCEALLSRQDLQHLQDGVKELNSSVLLQESRSSERIQSVRSVLSDLSRRVSVLDRSESRDTTLRTPSADLADDTGADPTADPADDPTADPADDPADNPGSSLSRRPRFLSRRQYKRLVPERGVEQVQRGGVFLKEDSRLGADPEHRH